MAISLRPVMTRGIIFNQPTTMTIMEIMKLFLRYSVTSFVAEDVDVHIDVYSDVDYCDCAMTCMAHHPSASAPPPPST
jgi:hypothetical protein